MIGGEVTHGASTTPWGTKVDRDDTIADRPSGYVPPRFDPYPQGALRTPLAAQAHIESERPPTDVGSAIERARSSIDAMIPAHDAPIHDGDELLLTEIYVTPEPSEDAPSTNHPSQSTNMTEGRLKNVPEVSDRRSTEPSDSIDEAPDDMTEEDEGATTDSGYSPMPVLDADGLPVIPSSPVMDRRDLYRLVMAYRRLDPRTSSEIVDAAGVGRMHANPMLNHGRPGNDLTLMAVARLYGIEPGFTAGRGVDASHYDGMDHADVIGPAVLSANEAGRRGSAAPRRTRPNTVGPSSPKRADDTVAPDVVTSRSRMRDENDARPTESGDSLIDRLIRTAGELGRRLLEATIGEARANARADEAEYLAKEAKAAAIAAEMRASEAERLLGEARHVMLRVRSLLTGDRDPS